MFIGIELMCSDYFVLPPQAGKVDETCDRIALLLGCVFAGWLRYVKKALFLPGPGPGSVPLCVLPRLHGTLANRSRSCCEIKIKIGRLRLDKC